MRNWREPQMNFRVYLYVPLNEYDLAKQMNCFFDNSMQKWYCIDYDYGKFSVSNCVKLWSFPQPFKFINNKIILLSTIPLSNRGFTL